MVRIKGTYGTLDARASKGVHFYVHVNPPVDADVGNQLQYLCGDDSCQLIKNGTHAKTIRKIPIKP